MRTEGIANLLHLVELLEAGERVEVSEATTLLSDFPAWVALVQMAADPWGVPRHGGSVNQTAFYERLLTLFKPYALLLDPQATPAARAARMQAAGLDVAAFCREHLHDGSPMIVAAAQEVLAAFDLQQSLVRGAQTPVEAPEELLRAVLPGPGSAKDLLHPTVSPASPPSPQADNWFRRLFARRK